MAWELAVLTTVFCLCCTASPQLNVCMPSHVRPEQASHLLRRLLLTVLQLLLQL
jgi:hypothetical protein